MTDDELEARLRRLAPAENKDAAFWDAMATDVRAAYERQAQRRTPPRRRRWLTTAGSALAMAAALTLWLRHSHNKSTVATEPGDTFHVFEDLEPGEMIEELSPEQLDHLAKAFNKGA